MTMKEDFLKGRRVLIVDDEEDVLEVLEQLLSLCYVAKARTFEEAKALLEAQPFDIAVLDIMGVDGYKLLEIANERKVIGVMLTAHAFSPEHLMQSIKRGAASYIPKEKMPEIRTFLNDILEAKQLGRHVWWRWHDRLGSLFEARFGPDWQKNEKEFWSNFLRAYGTRRV
jgi:DNA-binding NtrC family response regulator